SRTSSAPTCFRSHVARDETTSAMCMKYESQSARGSFTFRILHDPPDTAGPSTSIAPRTSSRITGLSTGFAPVSPPIARRWRAVEKLLLASDGIGPLWRLGHRGAAAEAGEAADAALHQEAADLGGWGKEGLAR